ncbi:MAG: ABC transporter permease [Armatimonadetes bacterium]|nr:ABC transporter permease [Armatimonadota bacterium]
MRERRHRLRAMVIKEFRQMRRNPILLCVLTLTPILQLILYGYAVTTDVRNVPVVICDESHSAEGRLIGEKIRISPCFVLVGHVQDPREIKRALDAGRAQIAVHLPPDFAREIRAGRSGAVGLYVDGSDSMSAVVASGYMVGLFEHYGAEIAMQRLRRMGPALPTPQVLAQPRVWYNPDLRSVNFMVPGVFGLIILLITMVWTSQSIVCERELGTIEQLMVTPIRPLELMLGKSLPYAAAAMLDAGGIVLLARLWFGVPVRGSLWLLFALAAVFILTSLGLGLLISTVSRTQQQALLAAFSLMMPSVLLSGFMFPIANMPWVMQQLTLLIPFRYFLEIVRGIFLKGVGLEVLWPQALALTLFGVALFTLGTLSFRKRLQ